MSALWYNTSARLLVFLLYKFSAIIVFDIQLVRYIVIQSDLE